MNFPQEEGNPRFLSFHNSLKMFHFDMKLRFK